MRLPIFRDQGLAEPQLALTLLIDLYGGNPLALKVITTIVQEVFDGSTIDFLQNNTLLLGDRLRSLLKQQVDRLSGLEKEVVYWLAIATEAVSLRQLRTCLLFPPSQSQLTEAMVSLERRSLIDKIPENKEILFTLQPLVTKYIIEELVEQSLEEIDRVLQSQDISHFKVLKNYSLTKDKDNSSGKTNSRLLQRLKSRLQAVFRCDCPSIAQEIKQILPLLEGKKFLQIGYAISNLQEICQVLSEQ